MDVLEGELLFDSDAYEVVTTSEKGRHMLATRAIKTGELILAERVTLQCKTVEAMVSASPEMVERGLFALSSLQPQQLSEMDEEQRVEATEELAEHTQDDGADATDSLVLLWKKWRLNRFSEGVFTRQTAGSCVLTEPKS